MNYLRRMFAVLNFQKHNEMEITRTKLSMTVTCKCGSVIAATMLYGGVEIDSEFMDLVAKTANDGGTIQIVNTSDTKVVLSECKC